MTIRTTGTALFLLLALAGCGSDDAESPAEAAPASALPAAASTAAASTAAASTAAAKPAPLGDYGYGAVNTDPPAATPAAAPDAGPTVVIENASFSPATLNVKPGTTVTVVNKDSSAHTFSSVSGPADFDSGRLGKDESAPVVFATVGSYEYKCNIHPAMTGTVTVG